MSEILNIDGSVLEGGGQILRISISLSAILGVPIRVYNIRAGRKNPGLAAQHLKGIELVAEMCQARLKGANIGSTEVEFIPGKIQGGHYTVDVKTAGSVSLLLQVALPVALMAYAPVSFDLRGGTNADMAPQIDYMGEVFRYLLNKFGADFSLDVHRRGYYPRGGGHVTVEVTPVQTLRGAVLTERGTLRNIYGWSFVAGTLPIKLANEMAGGVRDRVGRFCKVNIECYKEDHKVAPDNCSGIVVVGEFSSGCVVGSDALGSRGSVPRELGTKVGDDLARLFDNGACVDDHAQDQLIVYMALATGRSAVRAGALSLHTRTAVHVAELIAKVKFDVQPSGENNIIECTGLGVINENMAVK